MDDQKMEAFDQIYAQNKYVFEWLDMFSFYYRRENASYFIKVLGKMHQVIGFYKVEFKFWSLEGKIEVTTSLGPYS